MRNTGGLPRAIALWINDLPLRARRSSGRIPGMLGCPIRFGQNRPLINDLPALRDPAIGAFTVIGPETRRNRSDRVAAAATQSISGVQRIDAS
jgi:hypothetical protein